MPFLKRHFKFLPFIKGNFENKGRKKAKKSKGNCPIPSLQFSNYLLIVPKEEIRITGITGREVETVKIDVRDKSKE